MNQKDWWNARFSDDKEIISQGLQAESVKILTDELWMQSVQGFDEMLAKVAGSRVLDLGCGFGQLSKHFKDRGFDVTAVDFSENALSILKSHSPGIKTMVHDITKKLPFESDSFDVIIANLSLHYFDEESTRSAIAEIERVLTDGGLLIGSVVSTEEYEAVKNRGTFVEVEPNFYHEIFDSGKEKHIRFFSREDINHFFEGLEILYLENKFEQRMGKAKGAWEFILTKRA